MAWKVASLSWSPNLPSQPSPCNEPEVAEKSQPNCILSQHRRALVPSQPEPRKEPEIAQRGQGNAKYLEIFVTELQALGDLVVGDQHVLARVALDVIFPDRIILGHF